jgi:hypothetical protein
LLRKALQLPQPLLLPLRRKKLPLLPSVVQMRPPLPLQLNRLQLLLLPKPPQPQSLKLLPLQNLSQNPLSS